MASDNRASELMAALDYILNRCTIREIDAVESAVERRRRDLSAGNGIISLDPARAAKAMTGVVNESIGRSMEGVKNTFREFARDLLAREAPELSPEDADRLVESWIPEAAPGSSDARAAPEANARYAGLARKGLVNGVPVDAMREMVSQFVSYSLGSMRVSDEAALRDEIGDWTGIYWKKFPNEIRSLIKGVLTGLVSGPEFNDGLDTLLS